MLAIPNPRRDFIDLRETGGRGDGVTNNRQALGLAIAAAQETGIGRVVIPEGDHLVTPTGADDYVDVVGDVTLVGKGDRTSILRYEVNTFAYDAFRVRIGSHLAVRDLCIDGPPLNTGVTFDNQPLTAAFRIPNHTADGFHSSVSLDNVRVIDFFRTGFFGPADSVGLTAGERLFLARDSTIEALSGAAEIYSNSVGLSSLELFNCQIDAGTRLGGGTGSYEPGRGNALYMHPGVNQFVNGCHFIDNERVAIRCDGTTATAPPKYSVITNCFFDDTIMGSCIKNSAYNAPMITNCRSTPNAEAFLWTEGGGAFISGCDIQGANILSFEASGTPIAPYYEFTNCRFNMRGFMNSTPEFGMVRCLFNNCVWWGTNDGAVVLTSFEVPDGFRMDFQGCLFEPVLAQAACQVGGVAGNLGRASYRGCRFLGAYSRGVFDLFNNNFHSLALLDCEFCGLADTETPFYWQSVGGAIGRKVAARGLIFGSTQRIAYIQSGAITPQNFSLPDGWADASVAAADTIYLPPVANRFSISGGGVAINNIFIDNADLAQDPTPMFGSARLFLQHLANHSTGSGGNLEPETTGARQAGSLSAWTYNPSTSHWVEV